MTAPRRFTIELVDAIRDLPAASWDALVASESPFLSHAFLSLLEETGCVGTERSGWFPCLLVAREEGAAPDAPLMGALPLYLKTNSEGEFVFDWAWADAAYRAGIPYYPKGVIAVPFSPVTAKKIIISSNLNKDERDALGRALIAAAIAFADRNDLSSLHFNFLLEEELPLFDDSPAALRYGMQYHWYNGIDRDLSRPYEDFDQFLSRFRSKRRANLRRERRVLEEQGVSTRVLRGEAIDEAVMSKMFDFYLDTIHKFYYGRQYLNRDFFLALPERLGDALHLVIASQDGEDFAGALNLYAHERLYGRYWGCTRQVEFAHFEVCMYTPITWCIEHGAKIFEPGAGGEHKYERGFEPTTTYSMHHVRDPRLSHGVAQFLEQERAARAAQIAELSALSPFKDATPLS